MISMCYLFKEFIVINQLPGCLVGENIISPTYWAAVYFNSTLRSSDVND
jgi:hypothetical protein